MLLNTEFAKRYEKMPVQISTNSAKASKEVADYIIDAIKKATPSKKCVLCLDASSAAVLIYQALVTANKKGTISFKNVIVYSKSEYYPLDRKELQSHYRFLKEYIFDYVDIPEENIKCIDSKERKNIKSYCEQYEKSIKADGGFDIVLTSISGFNQADRKSTR